MTLVPDPLPNDVAALQAIIAKQAKELDERAAALSDAKTEIKARDLVIEQLQLTLDKLKRSQFGRSSEKIQRQIDQLELTLEDLQTDQAAEQAEEGDEDSDQARDDEKPKRRRGRKKLPVHLPRERSVLDPGDICPDCGGELRLLGEDINELLDYVSAQLKVLQIARLKKSCRRCEKIVQEPAPSNPIHRGMAGAGLLSHILVSKFDDHLPLYRQGEIFARLGIDIPRSTLIGWTGAAIAELRPIAELIAKATLTAPHLHCDDTIIPVLAPKTGKTKKSRMWVVVRDGRPYQGSDPPAVVYFYSPDRKGEHPRAFMKGFNGVLQADGFSGFNAMYKPDPETQEIQVKEAGCWAHWRRKFYDFHQSTSSPIAKEALERIGKLYDIERTINGKTKEQRLALRNAKSRPLTTKFKAWLEAQLKKLPEKSDLTNAIRYGLSRWQAFTPERYGSTAFSLDDPAVAIDNNAAERAMRPLVIGRRNWTFAGSDRGAENAAAIMTIVETAKLSNINPQTYIADLLNRLPDHKINQLEELLPWNWKQAE
ncbi:MAG: IS66 family transposase [Geminicoccaceae bacterium]